MIGGLGRTRSRRCAPPRPLPTLAAHARTVAHQYELAPAPGTEDLVWLATEYTHADLARHGVAAARYTATDALAAAGIDLDTDGIDRIAGSGHPHAAEVADALRAVAGSPSRCSSSRSP